MPQIPKPSYPIALDSDYTLFHVYNSTQSVLTLNLSAEDDIIHLSPKSANDPEVWGDNGFVKIEEELIYYDSVEKDENGKVFVLKECIRGFEGSAESYFAGTAVYGTVVAQQHNQLVDAILELEDVIGDINDILVQQPVTGFAARKTMANTKPAYNPEKNMSLHTSLGEMLGCAPVGDDACPDVEFEVNLDPQAGFPQNVEFCLRIFGEFISFEIDFDDGNTTTTQFSGVHTYALPGEYNAKVTVLAANCCILQQSTTPNEACEGVVLPSPAVPFHLRIPEVPPFPQFIAPKQICPGPLINLPPIIMPELNLCSLAVPSLVCPANIISIAIDGQQCPSVISVLSPCEISILSFVGCDIPSIISCVGCNFPSVISCVCPSTLNVEFGPPPSFDCISFCAVPSFDCISFCDVPTFPPISFAPFPSVAPVSFEVIVNLSTDCIQFCDVPSFDCISFCDVPTFPPISFAPFPSVAPVSFEVIVNLSLDCISFCDIPSFAECISFCDVPTFADCISFCDVPSFPECISFCDAPSFAPIGFGPPPSFDCISFCDAPSFAPIEFAPPPSFAPIEFGPPPTISVDFGTPPVLSCVLTVVCPSVASTPSCPPTEFAAAGFATGKPIPAARYQAGYAHDEIPITLDELGIPEQIKIIAPKIPDIKVRHDLPKEIYLKAPAIPDIRIIGPENPLPQEIKIIGNIPETINVVSDMPKQIKLDTTDLPRKFIVEPAPNFPSALKLEPLEVTGVPKSIEIVHDIPKTIQLVMPENPVVEMKYSGAPIDLNVHVNINKTTLSDIIIEQI